MVYLVLQNNLRIQNINASTHTKKTLLRTSFIGQEIR